MCDLKYKNKILCNNLIESLNLSRETADGNVMILKNSGVKIVVFELPHTGLDTLK